MIRSTQPAARTSSPSRSRGHPRPRPLLWPAAAFIGILLLAGSAVPSPLTAQLESPQASSADLGLLLRQMDGEKRVLMIAAHPDDEDTSLLTTLARGLGARAAYLSLSRGEGGQNLIGPELDEGLGIVRTGELLSARRLDGAEQFFARAFDFGFSRRADETFRHWPREELLRDVVWVVRTFRPHVIVSIFTGTDRDGHGQHQAAGIVSREAFDAAADPSRFPGQLQDGVEPWAPLKLYSSTRFRPSEATIQIETGQLDPLLGRSHFQVAMESRSRHRSQDMGAPRTPGPRSTGLELIQSRVKPDRPDAGGDPTAGIRDGGSPGDRIPDPGIFSGIDTTLEGRAMAVSGPHQAALVADIREYRNLVRHADSRLLAGEPGRLIPDDLLGAQETLGRALERAKEAQPGPARRELLHVLEDRERKVTEALLASARVVVDVRLDRDRASPGQEVEAQVLVWNGGKRRWFVDDIELQLPEGWRVWPGPVDDQPEQDIFLSFFGMDPETLSSSPPTPANPAALAPGQMIRWAYRIQIPPDAEPSRLYYLHEDRDGSLYRWPDERDLHGLPGNPPLVEGRIRLRMENSTLSPVVRQGLHVGVDKALGEFRVPFLVAPALSVSVDRTSMVWPGHRSGPRTLTVRITNHTPRASRGEIRLEAPPGWTVEPEARSFSIPGDGGEVGERFQLVPPGAHEAGESLSGQEAEEPWSGEADHARIRAVVRADGRVIDEGLTVIDHPHIDPVPFYEDAAVRISRFPVHVTAGLRVGYLMGPGDGGMQALRDLGVEVEPLGPEEFRAGDLERFDAIVLGIRAYETREDLLAANDRLLDFARRGGTVVVQYNKYEYPDGGFAPYPLAMRRPHDRVTDPQAPVTLLRPDHPLLSRPNRITEADFQGWNQERGLYFLSHWDERYTPLLEMSDPGQDPNRGSLMVTRVDQGAYVYTGLALFRQFPHRVPGAFRLLANLVSLRGEHLAEVADGSPADGNER